MASQAVTNAVSQGRRKFGQKQIFLPNFTLTLLRTPKQPPTFASFIVPLNLNKLDLRDYLWHCYGVPVTGVRSFIQMQKLRQDKPGARRPAPRRWYRPRSVKKMMVEMEKPFVWPEEPSLEKWDKTIYDEGQKAREEQNETVRPDFRQQPSRDRGSIAEQAKLLLQGKETWRPTNVKNAKMWEDMGTAHEVETDVVLPPREEL